MGLGVLLLLLLLLLFGVVWAASESHSYFWDRLACDVNI